MSDPSRRAAASCGAAARQAGVSRAHADCSSYAAAEQAAGSRPQIALASGWSSLITTLKGLAPTARCLRNVADGRHPSGSRPTGRLDLTASPGETNSRSRGPDRARPTRTRSARSGTSRSDRKRRARRLLTGSVSVTLLAKFVTSGRNPAGLRLYVRPKGFEPLTS